MIYLQPNVRKEEEEKGDDCFHVLECFEQWYPRRDEV
jgi:hypothetical protein